MLIKSTTLQLTFGGISVVLKDCLARLWSQTEPLVLQSALPFLPLWLFPHSLLNFYWVAYTCSLVLRCSIAICSQTTLQFASPTPQSDFIYLCLPFTVLFGSYTCITLLIHGLCLSLINDANLVVTVSATVKCYLVAHVV